MQQNRFKKILMVIGLASFLLSGFIATNIITSCPAGAQVCACSLCTYGAGGMGTIIPIISSSVVIPDISIVSSGLILYAAPVITAYGIAGAQKAIEIGRNQEAWWDTFWWANMRPALQAMTAQLTVRDADQSRVIGSITDAAEVTRTAREFKDQEIDSHREVRPGGTVCVGATVSASLTSAATFQRAYASAAPAEALARTANTTGPAAKGAGADQKARWQAYESRYCDATANNGAAGCTASAPFAGHDIDVTGQIFAKETIDVRNDDIRRTIDDLVANIAEPVVVDPIPAEALTSAQGQERMLDIQAYRAQRQTVYDALYFVVSRRLPASGAGDFVKEVRQAAGIPAATFPADYMPSRNEVMHVMMSERYRTGTFSIDQIDEPENNSREAVIQQAFQAMQMSDTLDLLDRYALMLAAQASFDIRETKGAGNADSGRPVR